VLIAIIKKQLNLNASLYTVLQILSVTLFEKIPIEQALTINQYKNDELEIDKQLDLFDF
jgi:hypothetical protein